jgi:hypothetical protein
MITAAKKNEIYKLAEEAIQRIAGNVGLNDGAIPEYPGDCPLGMGIIGGADCGP